MSGLWRADFVTKISRKDGIIHIQKQDNIDCKLIHVSLKKKKNYVLAIY